MPATEMANEPNGPRFEASRPEAARTEAPDDAELDERARKRIEVGLSPRRPTAKAAPQRPPDVQTLPMPPLALALLLLLILGLTTGLVVMNLSGWMPAWWPRALSTGRETDSQATGVQQALPLAPGAYILALSEDFNAQTSALSQDEERQGWRTELLAAESVYRIQVWPGHLAWSLLGLEAAAPYRLQTSVVAAAETPDGYAGLIVRYQDERHFYLFAVDGQGRYLV
ncbi:MAG TPA: hypothetical protein VNK95_01605, partial [Caldilineaceae bacterium]|nr:hypothetical protein [Caldilineaceae bacterium]